MILETRLSEILFKFRFQTKSNLNQILKQMIFFKKWKAMILEMLRQSFGFAVESNKDLNESGRFLYAL
jgi:hypothetical protein